MRVFINAKHFATEHTWNGKKFLCVLEEDEALKRKNNNVNDISWDNNMREILIYTPLDSFPGGEIPEPNTQVMFDRQTMWIRNVAHHMGMIEISLIARDPRELMV